MEMHDLELPAGFNPETQKIMATFAAQLEAQSVQLKKAVDGLDVAGLEWQQKPGINSIGMLLAHNAIVETFWISVAASGLQPDAEGEKIIQDIIGFKGNDDGMPLAADGKHPETLKDITLRGYLTMLDAAREATLARLKSWFDTDLDASFVLEGKHEFTRAWILYHVLEHFISHLGQIRLLKHMMAD